MTDLRTFCKECEKELNHEATHFFWINANNPSAIVERCGCEPETAEPDPKAELLTSILDVHVDRLIEAEKESNKTSLLEADWSDTLAHYHNDIKAAMADYFDIDEDIADYILENSHLWNDDVYEYQESGFPHSREGGFSIASVGEIEICPDTLKRHYYIDSMIEEIRELVNDNTSLYLNDNGYGYINMDYDTIRLNFDKFDMDSWKESYKESSNPWS